MCDRAREQVLDGFSKLGSAYERLGRLSDAEKAYESALSLAIMLHGPGSHDVYSILVSLIRVLRTTGPNWLCERHSLQAKRIWRFEQAEQNTPLSTKPCLPELNG